MIARLPVFDKIKATVRSVDPDATVILYGSYARGEQREDSDIDILVLASKDGNEISREEKNKIAFPVYHLGTDEDLWISVKIYTKEGWRTHRVTPYYENVNREGIVL